MGQRSQIFIDIDYETYNSYEQKWITHNFLIGSYYQWNYGERMISRARYTLEWLKKTYRYLYFNTRELQKIMEVNFDMVDVVNTCDIIKEYKEDGYYDNLNDIFDGQDNNDGQLYIKVNGRSTDNTENDEIDISYCFVDYEGNYLGCATNYLNWDMSIDVDKSDWIQRFMQLAAQYDSDYSEAIEYTQNNIDELSNFRLMSEEEYLAFKIKDYSNYENIRR